MTSKIFEAINSTGVIKYFGAFLWGIVSVITNPSGVLMLPLIVGYIANTDSLSHLQAFKTSCAFCVGIIANLIVITTFGGCTKYLTLITAVTFIFMGLNITGIIRVKIPLITGALTLGILSGLSLGVHHANPVLSLSMYDVIVILAYILGYCSILVAAGTFAQIFSFYIHSGEDNIFTGLAKGVKILCGLVLIIGGVFLVNQGIGFHNP